MHIQWISNLLLHFSWADQITPGSLDRGRLLIYKDQWTTVPLNVMLNRLLAWCNLLGSPVGEEVLKVQGKSYASFNLLCLELLTPLSTSDRLIQILSQLSKAITSTSCTPHPQRKFPQHLLHDLTKLENRPWCLTEMAYEWCSTIYQSLECGESLLLLSLEVGFRHIDTQNPHTPAELTHTVRHRQLADIIFESGDGESIADLLLAWTFRENHSGEPPHYSTCV